MQIESTHKTRGLSLYRRRRSAASQFLVIGAKCHAALHGKYSPDIEDVKAVAAPVLRHRIVRNYKAEAEGISTDEIVKRLIAAN